MHAHQAHRGHIGLPCCSHRVGSSGWQLAALRTPEPAQRLRHICTARSENDQALEAESRSEARRRRREASTPIESTVVVDPADADMIEDTSNTRVPATPPEETEERRKARELLRRKSEIIMELAGAGADLDRVIKQHILEIDDLLLATLYKRILAAQKVEYEKEAAKGLTMLMQRLHAERSRYDASPAARLLDDALQIMDPASDLSFQDRQQEVKALLRQAFSAPGSRPIDVFGVAAAIAAGQEIDPDDVVSDFVPREAFMQETSDLLKGVMEMQHEIERAWKAGEVKDQEQAARLVKDRRLAIVQVQEIIALAQNLRL